MKTKLLTILSLTGLFLFISTADISAQYNWDDVVDQAVFSYGDPGEWDDGLVWNPAVIKDGGILKMWYTGADEIVWYGPTTKIGYAWSLDGIEWNRYVENPVLEAELDWEGSYLFGCVVIKDEDTFKMWYGASPNPGSPGAIIGYATSVDGINWTKYPSPVLQLGPESEWDDSHITPQAVIKEGNEYKMWYYAGRPGFPFEASLPQIGLATSSDGINWMKYNDPTTTEPPYAYSDPVLKVGSDGNWDSHRVIDPMVLETASGYEMWYAGLKAPINTDTKTHIGYATSEDGINWEKYPEPVFTDPRAWGRDLYGGTVLAFDDAYHLWYACFHSGEGMANPEIGYAKATTLLQMSDDLIVKVETLEDTDVLNEGQANALIKKLEAARKSINKGNCNAAINQLNAFINQVNAFMNGGILTNEQGNELIADAQAIIDILENFSGYKSGEPRLVDSDEISGVYDLEQNYPNPFNGTTTIIFTLAESNVTTLKVYNSMGQEVATPFSKVASANERYHIEFNGSNLVEGIYFYHLQSGENVNTIKKMMLIK